MHGVSERRGGGMKQKIVIDIRCDGNMCGECLHNLSGQCSIFGDLLDFDERLENHKRCVKCMNSMDHVILKKYKILGKQYRVSKLIIAAIDEKEAVRKAKLIWETWEDGIMDSIEIKQIDDDGNELHVGL